MTGAGGSGWTGDDRYAVRGPEGESEPGSNGQVLRNLLGIVDPEEMEEAESVALVAATVRIMESRVAGHRFTAEDVCYMHRLWLGEIYPWAGQYRNVNISKEEFAFASAHLIPQLMEQYENGPLAEYTPCRSQEIAEQARALAVTHAELILIHPFREGNGRCARLLALAMSLQAGYMQLDFGPMDEDGASYIRAIQRSLARDYGPMEALFALILQRSVEA